MRLFKNLSQAEWLAILFPLLLLVPNAALNFTERLPLLVALTNLLLPIGAYGLLLSLTKRIGVSVLCCLPFMIFSAFQIVLLYLYGESIIAVDMYLNVATTNPQEVSELLGNLLVAIGTVVVLYVPMIVWAVVDICRHRNLSELFLRRYRRVSAWVCGAGATFLILSFAFVASFDIDKDIFPVNVIHNLVTAVNRGMAAAEYPVTSADFKFRAKPTHDDAEREIYLLVVGETSRADNWQLLGYGRETNPRLSAMERLVAFPKALTQSNTTHKSVPMMLSDLTAADFDSISNRKSVITAFKEVGFHTAFFSNQRRNGSYIDYFGLEADTTVFLKDDGREHLDAELVALVKERLADTVMRKQFIVLHTYGSHFNYRDRYDDKFSHFVPDRTVDASSSHRAELVNAFDNTIRYIDSYLADLMDAVEAGGWSGVVVYASDHGEDIFDDERNRFLHASPVPTATQLHVPVVVWLSSAYNGSHPEKMMALARNRDRYVTPSVSLFHTVVDLAGVDFTRRDLSLSLSSDGYSEPVKSYLTDRNEMVALEHSGLKPVDVEKLHMKNIL